MKDSEELLRLAETVSDRLVDSVIIGHRSSPGLLVLKGAHEDGEQWRIQVISISGVESISTRIPTQQMRRYGENSLRFLDEEEYIARVGTWQDPLNRTLGIQMLLYSGRTIEVVGNLTVDLIEGDLAEKTYTVPSEVTLPKPTVEIGHETKSPIPEPDARAQTQLDDHDATQAIEAGISSEPMEPTEDNLHMKTDEESFDEIVEVLEEEATTGGDNPESKPEVWEAKPSKGIAEIDFQKSSAGGKEPLEETSGSHSRSKEDLQYIQGEETETGKFWADPTTPKDQGYKQIEGDDIIEEIDRKLEEVERKTDRKFGKNGERPQSPLRPEDLEKMTGNLEESDGDDQNRG